MTIAWMQMVSAERLFQYSALEPEAPLDTAPPSKKPPPEWPQQGEIVMNKVSFRYSEDTPVVLKSLSCSIKPAEKVIIIMDYLQQVCQMCFTGRHSRKNWSWKIFIACTALSTG